MFDVRGLMFDLKARKPSGMRNVEARLGEPGTRSGARYGSILWMKSDPFPGRRRLSDELFNCGEDSRKLFIIFLFQTLDLARQVAVTVHQTAELHKSAHDRDIYFNGTRAAQHAGKHRDSLFSKGVRQVTPAAAPGV